MGVDLLVACMCGDWRTIERELDSMNVDIDAPINDDGDTLLTKSLFYGQSELVDCLLMRGANPNVAMCNGRTALMTAAGIGN